MKMIRELKRCLKHGILERLFLFLFPVIITVIVCMHFKTYIINGSLVDTYLFFLYRGMSFPIDNLEIIPSGIWLFNCVYPLVIIAVYIKESRDKFFVSELMKLNNKKIWFYARYITCLSITVMFYIIEFITIVLYSLLNKNDTNRLVDIKIESLIDSKYAYELIFKNIILICMVMVLVVMAFVSLMYLLSMFLNIIVAGLVSLMLIIATVYIKVDWYIGNLLMIMRGLPKEIVIINIIIAVAIIIVTVLGIAIMSDKVNENKY